MVFMTEKFSAVQKRGLGLLPKQGPQFPMATWVLELSLYHSRILDSDWSEVTLAARQVTGLY